MNELERALVEVGRDLDVPETPALLQGVLAGLEHPRPRPARRRWAVAVALVLVAALAATLAIPEARSALFRVLHIGGERIELVDELPTVPAADLDLTLGERVSIEEARDAGRFPLRELEEPADAAYLGRGGTIWFRYGDEDRPRLLVAQTPYWSLAPPVFAKKLLARGSKLEFVTVNGAPALYVSGAPHLVVLLDETGQPVEETARLARDVLVWEEDGTAFRLEGDFSAEIAVELAENLRVRAGG